MSRANKIMCIYHGETENGQKRSNTEVKRNGKIKRTEIVFKQQDEFTTFGHSSNSLFTMSETNIWGTHTTFPRILIIEQMNSLSWNIGKFIELKIMITQLS